MVHYGIVFYSLLNIAGLNSLIILKENVSEARMKRRRFLQTLYEAKDLCREQIMSKINLKTYRYGPKIVLNTFLVSKIKLGHHQQDR